MKIIFSFCLPQIMSTLEKLQKEEKYIPFFPFLLVKKHKNEHGPEEKICI